MLGRVRTELSVDSRLRELAMCTVAVVNGAEYEFGQHAPLYIAAGGTEAGTQALRNPDTAASDPQFSKYEQATIKLSIEMTRHVAVSDQTFEACHALLGDRKTVELVATVAAYNMVSRFLVALNVHAQ